MLFCPSCKRVFESSSTECPDDHVQLVNDLPFQTIDGGEKTWVEIASVGRPTKAALIKGFLDSEGIDCQIESLKFSMEPVNFGSMGEIRIYVPADREAEAMELLREREKDFGGDDE